ncbi:benzyl alcohol O-benzoyltransferase-like [Prosopis cineraria]|uniref:benzyl alcohol O-benzoyltransferase-like n=1 Tax=Prosopis cineraria TaxID=364024 RepID=UPI00240F85CB|nr:benzyl alcohol O-benzoyltransferase-like [Prosopis cineraria]
MSDQVFTVIRQEPELIAPARPTPHEVKLLSDIDDQDGLRFQISAVFFYPDKPSMEGKDPAHSIKKALSQTLVFYYPFAGRLREGPCRKLMVDCNEEGVIFIEADADVTLKQFGHPLQPPIPCFEEILYNVPGSEGIINCPLLLVQVTRLKCGGFILAFRLNHAMSDALGFIQFLKALAEIAQGACEPSIPPIWHRELLNARDPPRITFTHLEYEEVPNDTKMTKDMSHHSFFFGSNELEAIHQMFPNDHHGQHTTFEVLTAFLWRLRTISLQLDPDEEVRFVCACNVRSKSNPSFVPLGYYGNAVMYPTVVTTAGKLCGNSFEFALELVKKAKSEATVEYIQSVADLMVIRGRPSFILTRSWLVSNLTRVGFRDVDFGWGKAVYGGPGIAGFGPFPEISYFIACKNAQGEEGVVVPICLPADSMKMLVRELDKMLGNNLS